MKYSVAFTVVAVVVGCVGYTQVREIAPANVPANLIGLLGTYVSGTDTLYVRENDRRIEIGRDERSFADFRKRFEPADESTYVLIKGKTPGVKPLHNFLFRWEDHVFRLHEIRREDGPSQLTDKTKERFFVRTSGSSVGGTTFRITPLRPVEELRAEALRASPPNESGDFLSSDLVDVAKLDSTINLDIRYATTNNFMGTTFYTSARAFLQRPAAEGLVRAHHRLKQYGYGILIHDCYRPWYVTKMFWDATPDENKIFVADPSKGSRHNRGCAADVSLFELSTGKPVGMISGYDEMSARSYADFPGGTSLQRWHRSLLRRSMESEGFVVYPWEWWHFDYKEWKKYPIGTKTFEELSQ